jgi:hypothetical protein
MHHRGRLAALLAGWMDNKQQQGQQQGRTGAHISHGSKRSLPGVSSRGFHWACSPSEAPGSCRGCLLYSTRTANTPGLLPALLLLLPAGALLVLLLPREVPGMLLLLPMLLLGLRVGGVSSQSSNTRLLIYGGQRLSSEPNAASNKKSIKHTHAGFSIGLGLGFRAPRCCQTGRSYRCVHAAEDRKVCQKARQYHSTRTVTCMLPQASHVMDLHASHTVCKTIQQMQ